MSTCSTQQLGYIHLQLVAVCLQDCVSLTAQQFSCYNAPCLVLVLLHCRGAAAGVLTLFVAGGIHAADVQLLGSAADANTDCSWDETALEQLCSQHGVRPTYCMPYLQP